MAGFDETKFREAALKAGYSEAEINAELKGPAPAGAVAPQAIASGPETAAKFDAEGEARRAEIVKGFEESSKKDASESPMTVPGVLTSTPALVTGAAILGALTTYVAPKIYKSVKERYMTKTPEIDRNIDIPTGGFFDVPPNPNVNPVEQPAVQDLDKLKRAEELAEANRQLGIGNQPVAPGPIARNALPMGAVNPAMFSSSPKAPVFDTPPATPFSSAPPGAPAPESSAGPNSSTTSIVNNTVKEMIDEVDKPAQELRTGTGKPAFAGTGPEAKISKRTGKPQFKSEYASLADVPKGYAVVPNAQYVDVLRGIGQPEFTQAFTGRNFPTDYDQAVEATKEINRQLGRPTRAEAKAAGQPYGENVPGITQRTTENKKLVNVKGVGLGALVAIPNLVNAAQQGNYGSAAVQAADIATDYLPFVGQIKQALSPSSAGAGSDMPPSMAQAMLLGSPYAQSDFAKKQRQEQEYVRKVGAGRGIAPPSAYQR